MIEVDKVTISEWAEWWSDEDPAAAVEEFSNLRTAMTSDEKDHLDEIIAAAQMKDDPEVDATDSAIVARCLMDNGFHPAFEYNSVISGQSAFDRLKASSGSALKR